ncbi:MAG: FecR domain-containing protein [Leptonema illini]|uniref:FecR domain-containing protein n=1 Tax=Leptonema illini TaxID=183 RepID=A0A833GX97_9LEPT|nr:MAG: FecR domain-containing protein [Leptonema illini]
MSEQRFEDLARRILDEPSSSWPEELKGLRTQKKAMPEGLRLRLQAMNEAALQEKRQDDAKEAALESDSTSSADGKPADGRVLQMKRFRRIAAFSSLPAAAAAAVLIYFGFIYSGPDRIPTTLSYAEGPIQLNAQTAEKGQDLIEGDVLSVPAEALASVEAPTVGVTLRLHGNTSLLMARLRPERLQFRLDQGSALARLQRDDSQTAKPGLAIVTETGEASVIGTVFSVEKNTQQTRLTTYEGTVSYRRRWSDLEDLPESLITESELLTRARRVFLEAKASVDKGKESVISASDFQTRLALIPALNQALNLPAVSALRNKESASKEQIDAALKAIDESLKNESTDTIVAGVQEAFGQPPEVTSLDGDSLAGRRQTMEALSVEERNRRFKEMMSKGGLDKETFRKQATELLGKAPQEIILVSGEHIFGTIFGENGKYTVYTASGVRIISPEEIEEILFE